MILRSYEYCDGKITQTYQSLSVRLEKMTATVDLKIYRAIKNDEFFIFKK